MQSGFARGIGQRLDLAVIARATTIKHHRRNALVHRCLRRERADFLRAGRIGGTIFRLALAHRRDRSNGLAGDVVNELDMDVFVRKADAHARTFARAADALADAPVTQLLQLVFFFLFSSQFVHGLGREH